MKVPALSAENTAAGSLRLQENSVMRRSYEAARNLVVGVSLLVSATIPAWAQGAAAAQAALSANELAKEISNPVTSLWQLQFQFNNVQLRVRISAL